MSLSLRRPTRGVGVQTVKGHEKESATAEVPGALGWGGGGSERRPGRGRRQGQSEPACGEESITFLFLLSIAPLPQNSNVKLSPCKLLQPGRGNQSVHGQGGWEPVTQDAHELGGQQRALFPGERGAPAPHKIQMRSAFLSETAALAGRIV